MPNADYRCSNRFLIDDSAASEGNNHSESALNNLLQNLQFQFAHNLYVDTLQLLIPDDLKARFFFLQHLEFCQCSDRILTCRKNYLVRECRLQHGLRPAALAAQTHACVGTGRSHNCTDHAGAGTLY